MNTQENLVEQLCSIRKNWKHQDFVDAYQDEWESIPKNISECHKMMEEYIHHTYDIDYIKEVINDEHVNK